MVTSSMKAIRVHQYGEVGELQVEEIARPEPQADEVLIQVRYAGVNPIDWKVRKGLVHHLIPMTFPYIPGLAISGIVEKVGSDVTQFQAGQAVFGMTLSGAYSQYTVSKANDLVQIPEGVSLEDAVALVSGASTAWKALFSEGDLQPGQTVLIHAAAGGVGQFAVQLAKWRGAKVIGTASTGNVEFVRSLGADQVIDYKNTAFEEVVSDVDLVVDAVGGDTLERSWSVIKKGGTLVSIVQPLSQEKANDLGIQVHFNTSKPTTENLRTLAVLMADGTIKAEIEQIYPLHEAAEAHKKSESRHARGRILLQAQSN